MMKFVLRPTLLSLALTIASHACAEDWPMWRHDPGRTGATTEVLPAKL
ncbi:uncharacterized protein METZ01_LOCUS222517, partial [marine metagenome]